MKSDVNHRDVFVVAVDDRATVAGTAFNTSTGTPELWLFEDLTKTNTLSVTTTTQTSSTATSSAH